MSYRPFICEMEICIPGSLAIRQVADCVLVLHEPTFTRRHDAHCWKVRLLDGQPFPSHLTDDVPAPAAPFDHRIVMAKHAAVDSLYAVSKSEILGGWVRPSLNNSLKADSLPKAEPKMVEMLLILTWELQTLKANSLRDFNHFWKLSLVPDGWRGSYTSYLASVLFTLS